MLLGGMGPTTPPAPVARFLPVYMLCTLGFFSVIMGVLFAPFAPMLHRFHWEESTPMQSGRNKDAE